MRYLAIPLVLAALAFGLVWFNSRRGPSRVDRRSDDAAWYRMADDTPMQTEFTREDEARAVCLTRTFMSGQAHWAMLGDDGIWRVRSVTDRGESLRTS